MASVNQLDCGILENVSEVKINTQTHSLLITNVTLAKCKDKKTYPRRKIYGFGRIQKSYVTIWQLNCFIQQNVKIQIPLCYIPFQRYSKLPFLC